MIDPESPFAKLGHTAPERSARKIVHVNFCDVCHYVWKSPAAAKVCVNCKGNGESARSLVSYETDVPLT